MQKKMQIVFVSITLLLLIATDTLEEKYVNRIANIQLIASFIMEFRITILIRTI